MESLQILQNCAKGKSKPICSFEKLPIGEYLVRKFDFVETKFGPKVRVDIGDRFVFLPQRFSEGVTKEIVDDYNITPKIMSYSGKDASQFNRYTNVFFFFFYLNY